MGSSRRPTPERLPCYTKALRCRRISLARMFKHRTGLTWQSARPLHYPPHRKVPIERFDNSIPGKLASKDLDVAYADHPLCV